MHNGGILSEHDPVSWRFYVYGKDDAGDPLFSFWMDLDDDIGVCIYERNQGAGKWLSTRHDDEEYQGRPPSDELLDVLEDLVIGDGVEGWRVTDLPNHERYFVQIVHGTIEQKGRAPPELLEFLSQVCGTEVRLA